MVDNEGFVRKQEKETEDFVAFGGLVSCFLVVIIQFLDLLVQIDNSSRVLGLL
jgi:hypothetical protein